MDYAGLARLASFFLLHSQKKETKEKATPSRLYPALLTLMGGNRKLAQNQLGSNSRLPKTPIKTALLGAAAGDENNEVQST
ncbi:MAG: hypothetical protein WA123_09245 [Methylotenera sp.]